MGKFKYLQRKPKLKIDSVNNTDIEKGTAILNKLFRLIKSNGTDLTVVQFWDKREFENEFLGDFHSKINQILFKNNINTIQSLPYFKKCSPNASNLFTDKIHPFTLKGQACLATILEDAVFDIKRY